MPSEVCIVAIGKIQKLPRYEYVEDDTGDKKSIDEKRLVAKNVLAVNFNADHQVIDGATISRFSETWKDLLENPSLLSIELL